MNIIQQLQQILQQVSPGLKTDGVWGDQTQAALELVKSQRNDIVHVGQSSSFADPVDVASYRKWVQIYLNAGYNKQEAEHRALAKGDNGVGEWGDDTTGPDPSCALHPDWLVQKWGSKDNAKHKIVLVTMEGKEQACVLKDICEFRNRVDLNPGAVRAFGLEPPILKPSSWKWA